MLKMQAGFAEHLKAEGPCEGWCEAAPRLSKMETLGVEPPRAREGPQRDLESPQKPLCVDLCASLFVLVLVKALTHKGLTHKGLGIDPNAQAATFVRRPLCVAFGPVAKSLDTHSCRDKEKNGHALALGMFRWV